MNSGVALLVLLFLVALARSGRGGGPPGVPALSNPLDIFPVPGGTFSDTWGAPRPGGRTHEGTDVFAPEGTGVFAAHAGRATVRQTPIGGNSVTLSGERGLSTYYAHLAEVFVETGAQVQAAEQIGTVGATGDAAGTPPHLHFQLWIDRKLQNPFPYLRGLA